MTVQVTVIIPVYRDWARLDRCLAALERQTLAAEDFDIVVANNEPQPRTEMRSLPANARMIHVPKPGSYAARNAAIAAAGGRYLAFTDSDCVPAPDWLRSGLALLGLHPEAQATGPITTFREPGASYLAYLYEANSVLNQRRFIARGYCATANLMVARAVFDRVGPFDETLLSGGDLEWGHRARQAGIPIVYGDGVEVGHAARASVGQVIKRKRRFAGSDATKPENPTGRYVLSRLRWPALRASASGGAEDPASRLKRRDEIALFFVRWLVRLSEASEFLLVRIGVKGPNRA